MAMTSTRKTQDRSDRTRRKILRAAVREFSTHGLSGARTDAIANSAKVNKALLYYYSKASRVCTPLRLKKSPEKS